jgi:hypothetical protein
MIELLNNEAIYQKFVQNELVKSERFLWIGTADIKVRAAWKALRTLSGRAFGSGETRG